MHYLTTIFNHYFPFPTELSYFNVNNNNDMEALREWYCGSSENLFRSGEDALKQLRSESVSEIAMITAFNESVKHLKCVSVNNL